jgi:hypothetical protein
MRMPERLTIAEDGRNARGTISKNNGLRFVIRNHKTSDCGASLDGIRFGSNARQASFLQSFCNRLSD